MCGGGYNLTVSLRPRKTPGSCSTCGEQRLLYDVCCQDFAFLYVSVHSSVCHDATARVQHWGELIRAYLRQRHGFPF